MQVVKKQTLMGQKYVLSLETFLVPPKQGFLLFKLLVANSGNYMHLSFVVHYKKRVCNNKLLSVNLNINSNH